MKLDCVLTAVNENVLYLDFIPIFIKTWNRLYPDVDVKIILIAKTIPESFKIYKDNIILFEPLENVLTSFTSQFIRLLYPCILDYKNGVMITDMDMLPMNSTYYTKNILEFDNNKFIYYRGNLLFKKKQLIMCYNVATPKIWKDIFKINSTDDIVNIIKDVSNNNTIKKGYGNTGWSIDQITLYRKVMDWNKKTNNLICLKDNQTKFKRLDRNKFNISNVNIRNNVTLGKYTDYHCYRPMSKYSKTNWEIFNLLPKVNDYSKLKFTKTKLKSPIGNGLFDIFINTSENILYKKKKINIINIENYKEIIYCIKSNPVLCEYIFEPEKNYIEDDGSYYSSYIKNGIRLYDINSKSRIDDTILDNVKRSIQDMKNKLNDYVKTNKLSGDWALHNLIYCLDTNKIYNVDLEGFYTYPLIHDNGNCDIKYCYKRFDKLLEIINKLQSKKIDINDEYFTLILWNPTLFQSEEILKNIPNIIEKKEIIVPKENLQDYIFDIYKLDTRCSHNIVLPPKIKKLNEYNDNHLIVKFKIENPEYKNNICYQAVQLKETIRSKYNSNIKNYVKDIIIHVADNFEQSKYIWEKNIDTPNTIKLFVQEAKNPLRYKLSWIDKYGKDGWNTINTMNVYENCLEGTKHFFEFRASNPRRYCLSKEKIIDDKWEYYFDFYCKESEVDKRMTMYKTVNSITIPNDWRKLGGYSHVNNKKEFFDLLLISENFNFKRNGFFIEIGANNGIIQSNTYMLEKHYDWKGLLVEPSLSGYNHCKKIRNNSIVINSCVGNKDDKKKEFIYGDFNGSCMSSINGERLNRKSNLVKCPITTLETILDEHCINEIDFFSLDVEGYEYQVLEGLNLKKYKPKYLLIEVYLNDKDKIESLLFNNNYKFVTNLSNYNRKDNPKWKGQHQDLLYKLSNNIIDYSQKYITGDNFKIICDFYINNNQLVAINNNVQKPFYGCFIFIRCGNEKNFFRYVFNSIKYPFYIVTHNSDLSSPNECYKYLENDKIIKWYCKNNDYDKYHHKLELIPLGLGNTRDKNILHQIHEKKKSFENKKYPYKCLISSNFSTYNGKTHPRSICYESLKNNSCVEIQPQRLNYEKYIEYILDYGFIISPHGNGLDCTRTWESILLGLIPVVKKSTLDRLYSNLPVMIVNDWNEITLDKLKNFKDNCKISDKYDLLYTYFWDNKFKNDRIFINNYIPKIIHQTYSSLDNLRSDYKKYSDGIKKIHFDYKYYFWSDDDMYNFVKIEYPHLYENYMSLPKKIYQIDIFKYLIIHNKGGIFIDMDYEFYKSLSPFIEYKHVFLPISHEKGSLNGNSKQAKLNLNSDLHPSSLFGSIKNYPLWIDLVEQILKDQDYNNNNGNAIFVTGPHILSKFLYNNKSKYENINKKNNYNVSNEKYIFFSQKYLNTTKQVAKHHCSGTWKDNVGDCYKNVKPIKQIFDKLTNYVVLRGYDDLHKKIPLLKNSDDIDILVSEKNDIVKLCGNNIVVINNERVKFDRRYIGDNYYDSKWQQNMIATKVKRHFFYVLDEQNNYYATLYHSLIHKGIIHNKYEKLFKTFENKHKMNSDILSRYYQLLKFMFRNNYAFKSAHDKGVGFFKNKYKLNLFIIRKKGIEREIIQNILNQIENEYQILDKILININNKKKFYSNFYENYDKHADDIEKNNDNQCLVIITNNPDDINPNELKQKIRKQYIKFYPPLGNIIHSSDSSNDCEKELEMLFNENIDNLKNIGTYYSQKMI